MAEGLAREVLPADFQIQSAGSFPSSVHPTAIEVMKEVGIDISSQHSKGAHSIDPDSVDLIITLCAEEVCPTSLSQGKQKLHWPMPDPVSASTYDDPLSGWRRVRDEIRKKLEELNKSLE